MIAIPTRAIANRCFSQSAPSLAQEPVVDPASFLRNHKELDSINGRVLSGGKELTADHPGFLDASYRKRRAYFAKMADNFRYPQPIPIADYTEAEHSVWRHVFKKLSVFYPKYACKEFLSAWKDMNTELNIANGIPQLAMVNEWLKARTGFLVRPISGLLSGRDFLNSLALRAFPSTMYIRHPSRPEFTPEPDIVHEILGHAPMLGDPDFAAFSQQLGLLSLGASDKDVARLVTCYWFTVEFGMVQENNVPKVCGAGILSSCGELPYAVGLDPKAKPEFRPANNLNEMSVTAYPITTMQPLYFVAESFPKMNESMLKFAQSIKRPNIPYYNALTQSIEFLEQPTVLEKAVVRHKREKAALSSGIAQLFDHLHPKPSFIEI